MNSAVRLLVLHNKEYTSLLTYLYINMQAYTHKHRNTHTYTLSLLYIVQPTDETYWFIRDLPYITYEMKRHMTLHNQKNIQFWGISGVPLLFSLFLCSLRLITGIDSFGGLKSDNPLDTPI